MRTTSPAQVKSMIDDYYLPLFRFAERLCGSPLRAMVLTQKTYNIALDRSQNLPVPHNLRAWLFTLLFHNFLETRQRLQHN